MHATDDSALVTQARQGDADAYGQLFERYESRIYNYAYGIAGNPDDAKDIAQDAFVRVFQALPKKEGELNFSAYLYRTAHNVAIDQVKQRSRFAAPDALDLEHEPALRADPERVALLREQQEQTWRAAFTLSDDHRAILTLRELQELSYQEIADIMDMPRNTVGVLLSRARLKFKGAFRMSSIDVDTLAKECQDMLPLLSAYIDDELDAAERSRVDTHLADCAFCRLALEEMTEASKSYRGLIPLLPPATLGAGVLSKLAEGQPLGGKRLAESGEATGPASDVAPAASSGAAPLPLRPRSRTWPIVLSSAATVAFLAIAAYFAFFASGDGPRWPLIGTGDAEPLAQAVSTPAKMGVPAANTASLSAQALVRETTEVEEEPVAEEEPSAPEPPSGLTVDPDPDVDHTPPATPLQIAPADGTVTSASSVALQWSAVKDFSGVTYFVEIEVGFVTGSAIVYSHYATVQDLPSTTYEHTLGSLRERWRVWAVDGAGNASPKSPWSRYSWGPA